VRSPDDAAPLAAGGTEEEGFSSSLKGLEKVLPTPGEEQPEKKKKLAVKNLVVKELSHQEVSSKDIEIGDYYLDTKNWKAALSRFESALVLDPENPEVYWGLAEAERHLGEFASARGYYQKAAEYDPDSRHGKEARKALQEPEIAHGKNAAPSQPQPTTKAPK
jgi:tetratricopeptide (TPR) repeat protein